MVVPKRVSVTGVAEDKVVVNKTVNESYVREATEEEKTANQNKNGVEIPEINSESNQDNFPVTRMAGTIPRNRLIDMFQQMREQYDEDEVFAIWVTRRADMHNDAYRVPTLSPIMFQPFEIMSNDMSSFFSRIQDMNGKSGGRFDIVVLDSNNEDTELGLKGLNIPNPIIKEVPLTDASGNPDLQAMMQLMAKEREEMRNMFQQMLGQRQQQPQEDDFVKALKQKMMQDLLNPPEKKNMLEEMMMMPAMMGTFTTTMAEVLKKVLDNTTGSNKPQGTLEMILGNEMVMEKVSDTVGKVVDAAGVVLANRGNPQQPPVYYTPQQGYPPLSGQQSAVSSEQKEPEVEKFTREDIENMQKIEDIIAELEDDTPLDSSNEFLIELKEEYPDQYKLAKTMCGVLPFDEAMKQLMPLVPFKNLKVDMLDYVNNTNPPSYTERGVKLFARLEILYNYIKSEQSAVSSEQKDDEEEDAS